ncbi:MAG: endonuclease/exonuclease/phosphatase family protein [Clostridiales bacterium]|nr:endonuclease/exonuclease/phosphatase family protein [Clostridiales bacterium]
MKVMSFNILCGGTGLKMISTRKPLVRDILRKYMPDTFGLQEAHSIWMKYIIKNMPEYDYVGVGRENGKKLGEYSPVFYRKDKFELVDSGNFWLSEDPDVPGKGWDAACTRICSYAVLKDKSTGKCFSHFNTHLDHVGAEAQSEGAKLIAERADMYPDVPTVVTGDFNVTPDSGAYKSIIGKGFLDARHMTENTDDTGTFHDFGKCSQIIDFIFVKNDIKVLSFKTVTELVRGKYPSDHYPVAAEIEF